MSRDDLLVGNLHYHPNGKEARTDKTRIGIYFGEGEPDREINAVLAGTMEFTIPAHAANHEIVSLYTLRHDSDLVSYFPHMHLRGKDMTFTAILPDGERETLLQVTNYDFDWQLFYYPVEPKRLPKGTVVEIVAHYDNSSDNPANPDPGRSVGFGLNSTDEMMFGVFELIEVADGDGETDQTDRTDETDETASSSSP